MPNRIATEGCVFWKANVTDNGVGLDWDLTITNQSDVEPWLQINIPDGESYESAFLKAKRQSERFDRPSDQAIKMGLSAYQQNIRLQTAEHQDIWLHEVVRIRQIRDDYWELQAICSDISGCVPTEQIHKDNDYHYRAIFDSSPLPMWICDPRSFRFIEVNDAAVRAYGYSHEEFLQITLLDIRLEEDIPAFLKSIALPAVGHSPRGTMRHRRKDGSTFHVEVTSSESDQFLSNGRIVRLVVVNDVSERFLAKQALRKTRMNLENAQRLANIGSWTYDLKTEAISLSDEFYRILGYESRGFEPTWEACRAMIHPDDLHLVDGPQIAQYPPTFPFEADLRIIRPTGEIRNVRSRVRASFDTHGKAVQIDGTVQDITETLNSQRELGWKSAFLEAHLLSSNIGMYLMDTEGNRIFKNQRADTLWKAPPEVANHPDTKVQLAHTFRTVKDPDSALSLLQFLMSHPEETVDVSIELVDGTILNCYSAPIIGKDQTIYGRYYAYTDITEVRRNEEELEAKVAQRTAELEISNNELILAKQAADSASLAKSEFLSRMSHELRTPLNSILGFSQILELNGLTPEQDEGVQMIQKSGKHLLNLINEILDISRVESGRSEISFQPVSLRVAINDTCVSMRPIADEYGIHPEATFIENSDFWVTADPKRLQQVLMNLISNGIKYNHPGGKVVVACSYGKESRVRIAVKDNGWGISEENIAKLFEPFERLVAGYSDIEGTGLGLVLSERLVTALGGELTVNSVLDKGSEFSFELKGSAEPNPKTPFGEFKLPGLTLQSSTVGTFSIMSIEDNPINVKLYDSILKTLPNVQYHNSKTGRWGIEMAILHHPDLILLDLQLPDCSGTEVLIDLKKNETTKDIPVIVITADATSMREPEVLAAGAYCFITKPIIILDFLDVVQNLISQKAAG